MAFSIGLPSGAYTGQRQSVWLCFRREKRSAGDVSRAFELVSGMLMGTLSGATTFSTFITSGEKWEKSIFPTILSHGMKNSSGLPPRFSSRPLSSRATTRAIQ